MNNISLAYDEYNKYYKYIIILPDDNLYKYEFYIISNINIKKNNKISDILFKIIALLIIIITLSYDILLLIIIFKSYYSYFY